MSNKKVLILNFPKISIDAPPLAPALLGSLCEKNNISYDFIDCNLEFYQQLSAQLKQEILVEYAEKFENTVLGKEAQSWLDSYFQDLSKKCNNYEIVAISVFTMHSSNLVSYFLSKFRQNFTACVVVGGAGLNDLGWDSTDQVKKIPFYKFLQQNKLIDYWTLGEGEEAFENIIQGNFSHPSVNSDNYNFLTDFSKVPTPSFSQFDLTAYQDMFNNRTLISVEGSRGCVKNCTFCDIKKIWGNYKFKDGVALAEELLTLEKKYNVDHFWFNDSLVNGSLKVFREFTQYLSENRKNKNFTWSGQAIIRNRSSNDETDFALLKNSGCQTLAVGLEHFSERVRFHMTKKFTDDDVDNFFNLAQKYNINLFLLMIVGYPTETQEDFDISLRKLEKYQHLADDGTISAINFGVTLNILPDTPLDSMKKSLNVVYPINSTDHSRLWSVDKNTPEQRIRWRIQIEEYARKLGYNCVDDQYIEQTMLTFLKNYRSQKNELD